MLFYRSGRVPSGSSVFLSAFRIYAHIPLCCTLAGFAASGSSGFISECNPGLFWLILHGGLPVPECCLFCSGLACMAACGSTHSGHLPMLLCCRPWCRLTRWPIVRACAFLFLPFARL